MGEGGFRRGRSGLGNGGGFWCVRDGFRLSGWMILVSGGWDGGLR